ncbi:MAG: FtsX-like permease family protein [Actinomycetota bacterium]|nr:FtsX-like permease family protein [Actinomycetota bacterium]MDA3008696.1 FtsX-like permease family protein [Actinomycetota bacterium]MDA3037739.1 FtsX-like permease family protein [Actinomycetota bacterium]
MFGFTKRPLFLIAWKNLKTYPVRIFLTTSSIILGVAVIIASNIFSESNKSAFDNLFSGIYEGVDLVVQPIQEDFAEGFSGDGGQGPISFEVKKIPDERIEEISNLPSVKAAWGEVLGFAQFIKIVDGETVLISNGFAPTFGAAWDSNPYAAQWSLVEGDPPTNTKEVVMDVVTAENHEFSVGDRVTVLAGATPASFTIVGIAEFANVGAPGGATFALFEFRTAQKLLDSRGEVDLINVVIENNFDINDVKTEITNLDSENLNVINAQEAAAEQADSIKQGLDFFNTILNVFAGIAIFVGAFIIQNTFRILLLQRTKELSLLRALGTSKRQIYRLVISESLFMSVIGSGLGIALGIGLAVAVKEGLQYFEFGLPDGPLVLTTEAAITGLIIGITVTILSSLLPARKASQVSPMEAIRDSVSTPRRKSLFIRLIFGSLISVAGFGMLFGVLYDFLDLPTLSSLQQVGFGAGVIFIGISVITPSITKPFVFLFDKAYNLVFGILGKLATENSKRTPRRTASTASALMIGLTLISLANVITTSFKAQAESLISEVILADYQVSASNVFVSPGIPTGLSEELLELDEVTKLSRTRATVVGYNQRPLILGAVDETVFDLVKTDDISGNRKDFLKKDAIGILKQTAEREELFVGDEVVLTIPEEGERTFTVTYIFDWTTQPPAEFFVLLENNTFFADESLDTELYFNVNKKTPELEEKINAIVDGYPGVEVRDEDGLVEEANNQIQLLLNVIYGFLSISIFVALFGITNTLSLSVYERTREIGLMRAIGTYRKQIRRMIFIESSIISIFGAALGTGLGIFFAWSLIQTLADEGFTVFAVSIPQTILWIGIAIIAGVIAAILPAIRAARQNILEAISYE